MGIQKPTRYGKPCLINLPPKLGRMVINAIIHSEPFDNTQLKKDCKRINRQLARIGTKEGVNKAAGKWYSKKPAYDQSCIFMYQTLRNLEN